MLLGGEEIKEDVADADTFLRLFSRCNNFILTDSRKDTGSMQQDVLFEAYCVITKTAGSE